MIVENGRWLRQVKLNARPRTAQVETSLSQYIRVDEANLKRLVYTHCPKIRLRETNINISPKWWYDGVYTVDLGTDVFLANDAEPRNASNPSLEGKQVLLDSATRDQDPYVGDLAVASLTSYLSHDPAESARKCSRGSGSTYTSALMDGFRSQACTSAQLHRWKRY